MNKNPVASDIPMDDASPADVVWHANGRGKMSESDVINALAAFIEDRGIDAAEVAEFFHVEHNIQFVDDSVPVGAFCYCDSCA